MLACVIYHGNRKGRRFAKKLHRFQARWRRVAEFWPTQAPRHAEELAIRAVERGFRIIAVAGGDGTVHEVANGLLTSASHEATFAVAPIGSANDYAYSIARQFGAAELDDEQGDPVDVGFVHTSLGRKRYFVESLGLGLSARVACEARTIRGPGALRYGRAAWRAMHQTFAFTNLRLSFDNQPAQVREALLLTLLLGRREGGFLLAPGALLDDGLFDCVEAGRLGRWEALRKLPALALRGPPTDHPQVRLSRCRFLSVEAVEPSNSLIVHADGEMLSTLDQNVRGFEVRLLPRRLRVKVCRV